MNKIVIAEDDLNFTKYLVNSFINELSDYKVVNIYTKGNEVLSNIKNLNSKDFLILDIGLPNIDGLEILKSLKNNKNLPNIIVISGNADLIYKLPDFDKYICSVFQKPIDALRLKEEFIRIQNIYKQNEVISFIEKELDIFEFNKTSIGYKYLVDAILEAINNPKLIQNLEKELYYSVSKKYINSTYLNIKWAIDKSINSMYRFTNFDLICNYFNFEKPKKPTSKLIIQTIMQKYMNKNDKF